MSMVTTSLKHDRAGREGDCESVCVCVCVCVVYISNIASDNLRNFLHASLF